MVEPETARAVTAADNKCLYLQLVCPLLNSDLLLYSYVSNSIIKQSVFTDEVALNGLVFSQFSS